MKKITLLLLICLFLIPVARANVGIHTGFGVPYVTQFGINYSVGSQWTFNAQYNNLDLSVGDAEAELKMPEFGVQWHPFIGAFYIGLGMGQQSLKVSASDSQTGEKAEVDVSSVTTITKLGWMWGKADGGFWFGMDLAYIIPSGSSVDVKASAGLPTTSQEYQDVKDAGERFGETAYLNITFARFGYLF